MEVNRLTFENHWAKQADPVRGVPLEGEKLGDTSASKAH